VNTGPRRPALSQHHSRKADDIAASRRISIRIWPPPSDGGPGVTADHLARITDLGRRSWDNTIIACLARGPRRFGDLVHTASRWRRTCLSESVLGRSLRHLAAANLVTQEIGGNGDALWALTQRGRAQLTRLRAVGRVLDRLDILAKADHT
jgi:DNA-binding HxlR family transcriptional regulator